MTVLAMSQGELSRFDTLMRVERGELRIEDAATLLGLKRRQIFRLLGRLREDGAAGLMSRKPGRVTAGTATPSATRSLRWSASIMRISDRHWRVSIWPSGMISGSRVRSCGRR